MLLQIMFLMSLKSSQQQGLRVHGLGSMMMFGLCGAKILEY
jgi:hypothetical protein